MQMDPTTILKQLQGTSWLPKSPPTPFPLEIAPISDSLDVLTYGIVLRRVSSWGNLVPRLFMILSESKSILQWVSGTKPPSKSRVLLNHVQCIYFGPS